MEITNLAESIITHTELGYNQCNQFLPIDERIWLMSATLREQLHQQIDRLPDHIVEQIANFTLLITTHQDNISEYSNWQDKDWQEFSLEQFFREEDQIEYSLEDAQEIYQP